MSTECKKISYNEKPKLYNEVDGVLIQRRIDDEFKTKNLILNG
jgi:hypothetical protein